MDRRRLYVEYLTCRQIFNQNLTPGDQRAVELSHKYFVFTNGILQRIRKGGNKNQVCIAKAQVPLYLAKIHGETTPHLRAIETWKVVAAGAYWWPTWGNDVCTYLRYCQICKGPETLRKQSLESQSPLPLDIIQTLDWKPSITQQLESRENLDHINTHEELGLLGINTKAYLITEDGLKYKLPKGKSKCV